MIDNTNYYGQEGCAVMQQNPNAASAIGADRVREIPAIINRINEFRERIGKSTDELREIADRLFTPLCGLNMARSMMAEKVEAPRGDIGNANHALDDLESEISVLVEQIRRFGRL